MSKTVKLGVARLRKITLEQEAELVELYMIAGLAGCAQRCKDLGVSPKYAASAAVAKGLRRPRWRKGNRYKDSDVDRSVRTHADPRWAKARAIGVVVV